jgi:predicted nucleic acid-binding protein
MTSSPPSTPLATSSATVAAREPVVVDASAFVDALTTTSPGPQVVERLRNHRLHAPAHLDAEVLSALARLHREGRLTDRQVASRLRHMAAASITRHAVAPLLSGAWKRRDNIRMVDALYVELAHRLGGAPLVTTDARLAAVVPTADLVT